MKVKTKFWIICSIGLAAIFVTSCGPSQAELDAQKTEIASNIFATQTAELPPPTQTLTPTPTPTITPTPTATPRPLSDAILTLDDLPAGFVAQQPADFGLEPGMLATFVSLDFSTETRIESGFGYLLDSKEDFLGILGATAKFPSRSAQARYANDMPLMIEAFSMGLTIFTGDESAEYDDLPELNIGDLSDGLSAVVNFGEVKMRFDIVLFRRDNIAAVLFLMYFDGDTPIISLEEIANKFDERIIEILDFQ